MRFFVGIHQPCDAHRFPAVFVSVNRLAARKSDFRVGDWIMDSGAFTLINKHGHYPEPPEVYAERINRWAGCGNMLAAVSQDYMCEPFVLAKTGLTVAEHQRLTIERYDAIRSASQAYVMPVLQGYQPEEYVSHLGQYGDRIARGQWVGVGSVCKRNSNPEAIVRVLGAILDERPDLKLHGFGVKSTALADGRVWRALHSADSMAWSFAARKQGRGGQRMAGGGEIQGMDRDEGAAAHDVRLAFRESLLGRKQLGNIRDYSQFGYVGFVIQDLLAYAEILEEIALPDQERIRP